MLVLSRKCHEQIQIGDSITISVLLIKGNVVRLGVEAPRSVHIVRAELPRWDSTPLAVESAEQFKDEATVPAHQETPVGTRQAVRCKPLRPGLRCRMLARLSSLATSATTVAQLAPNGSTAVTA